MANPISFNVALALTLAACINLVPCYHAAQISASPSSASLRATLRSSSTPAADHKADVDMHVESPFHSVELVNGSISFKTLFEHSGSCGSSRDFAFVVDASGSVGHAGIDATKQFLGHLSCRLRFGREDGFQMATTVQADMEPKLLSELTESKLVFLKGVQQLAFKKSPAMNLVAALGKADAAFMHGRQSAKSLILVIADGPGLRQRLIKQQVSSVSKSADLVVLLVADQYDETAQRAATEWLQAANSCTPHGCRLLQVSSYAELASADVTSVVAEMCRDLV